MNFLFDVAQEGRIAGSERRANQAADKAIDALSGVDSLKRRLDVMALANQALFDMLQSRLGISEEDVLQRMADIDARDGVSDGKIGARVVKCRARLDSAACFAAISSPMGICMKKRKRYNDDGLSGGRVHFRHGKLYRVIVVPAL